MTQMNIACLEEVSVLPSSLSGFFNSLEKNQLEHVPWTSFPYKPDVSFSIAYNKNYIFLKYFVAEKTLRATVNEINGSVWEDSCVEFFISFDDKGYYNLEFNSLGAALVGFGKEKQNRQLLSKEVISAIKFESVMKHTSNNLVCWELSLAIPVQVFVHHSLASLKGQECRANFYKCGDLLPEPHFIAWSPIGSKEPNFHLPEFFGSICFQ